MKKYDLIMEDKNKNPVKAGDYVFADNIYSSIASNGRVGKVINIVDPLCIGAYSACVQFTNYQTWLEKSEIKKLSNEELFKYKLEN